MFLEGFRRFVVSYTVRRHARQSHSIASVFLPARAFFTTERRGGIEHVSGVRPASARGPQQCGGTLRVLPQLSDDYRASRQAGSERAISQEEVPWRVAIRRCTARWLTAYSPSVHCPLSTAGSTKILPSPMRPVRATSTRVRTTSSTRRSSTQSVISTLGRKANEYSLPRYSSR